MRWPWGEREMFLWSSAAFNTLFHSKRVIFSSTWRNLTNISQTEAERLLSWRVSGWKLLLISVIQSQTEQEKLSLLLSCSLTSSLHIISSGSQEHLDSVCCLLNVDFDLWPPHWTWIVIVKELKLVLHPRECELANSGKTRFLWWYSNGSGYWSYAF